MRAFDMRRRSHALLQGRGYPLHELLPPLLEEAGEVRPARAAALYAFLLFLDGGDAYREPIGRWLAVERRRALEWMVSTDAWEDIELDT